MIEIEPQRETLHGQFSASLTPVATLDSGDRVCFRTLDVSWGMGQHPLRGNTRPKFEPREEGRDSGPALCGPVAIRGAEPGMTLQIDILEVRTARWGWTYVGRTGLNARLMAALGEPELGPYLMRWDLDPESGVARSETGQQVRLAPFPGTIGMPAGGVDGWQSGWHPRRTGGNMDCRLLVAGSTLYLPVELPGGLLSVGDGHAAQGDGELCGSAIECPLERLELRCTLRKDLSLRGPLVRSQEGWATLGFDADVDAAAAKAIHAMLDRVQAWMGLERAAAMAILSAAADLRITQLVNGVRGVHLMLPDGAILSAGATF